MSDIVETSDVRSNPNEQISHAVEVIKKSEPRRKVFIAIHTGKTPTKSITQIVEMTGLPRKTVLMETVNLRNNKIITKTTRNGELAYTKNYFFAQNKNKILRLASNPKALAIYPTKRNPTTVIKSTIVYLPRHLISVKPITIDDIQAFERVSSIRLTPSTPNVPMYEETFQQGLQRILNEQGQYIDWGGETDDLFTTRLTLYGKRIAAAFALKGKGTKGILTPKKLGAKGDQIQSLFKAPADIYLIQYWGQIDETVTDQMKSFATVNSVHEGKTVYYGTIDGQDSIRLARAYPQCFTEDTI